MRREGTDESNVQMSDVLCDFCRQEWTQSRPMIEGHLGACICGSCLRCAYTKLISMEADDRSDGTGAPCTMCREVRQQACFQSSSYSESWICLRCVRLAAKALSRDPDANWPDPAAAK